MDQFTIEEKAKRHDDLMEWLSLFKKQSQTRSQRHIVHDIARQIDSALAGRYNHVQDGGVQDAKYS